MDSPTPQNARQFAESAIAITRNVTGIELDLSPASLGRVDEVILGFRGEGLTADAMGETLTLFGCYVGEVILHNHGGAWQLARDTAMRPHAPGDMLVLETPNKAVWNPLGKAFKLMQNGEEDSLSFFYSVVTSQLPSVGT